MIYCAKIRNISETQKKMAGKYWKSLPNKIGLSHQCESYLIPKRASTTFTT